MSFRIGGFLMKTVTEYHDHGSVTTQSPVGTFSQLPVGVESLTKQDKRRFQKAGMMFGFRPIARHRGVDGYKEGDFALNGTYALWYNRPMQKVGAYKVIYRDPPTC